MSRRALVAGAVVLVAIVVAVVLATRKPHAPAATATTTPSATPPAASSGTTATPPHPTRDGGATTPHARVILSVPWGSGDGQLGRRADPESLAVGPASFVVDARGVVVLDGVNRRVARFERAGRPLAPIALDSEAAQDLARTKNGLAVLDRLHDKRVTVYDGDGTARATLPLVGPGIGEPAAVTGIFADRDGALFAEREHGAWMRLAGADGKPDATRAPAPGRPMRDGRFVAVALADRAQGLVRVRVYADAESGAPAWESTVRLGAPALFVALADGDAAGRVYVGAHTGREQATPPYAIVDESLVLVALSPSGAEQARLVLPAPPPSEEAFRDLYVGDDGTIYWMRRTAAGVVVEAYRL